ncbi:uncharacterized protein F5Z01DRAFT_669479 [Emericellopsis atlantica]|uniref:Uncharacterized protein n=1 Tax=Emericellopsis atlantica TaxID=2614577 RepID=A0A9P7ZCS9_9HYPO|nr:uncharacterized protein F5Z01DRAFT_669479 [Emericellopsis atlantica]KAG9249347.1 hypothetical protein F5Z01DRAFT_669479 [Emericellopsis atlantica]
MFHPLRTLLSRVPRHPSPEQTQLVAFWSSARAKTARCMASVESKRFEPTWRVVWGKFLKRSAWQQTMKKYNLVVGIVGWDLQSVAMDDVKMDKLVALLLPGEAQVPAGFREDFLKCLRPHVEKKKDELYFPEWRLTLNISSLRDGDRIVISRPHLLFSLQDSLQGALKTAFLFYDGEPTLWEIGGGHIGGLCDSGRTPRTTGEVKDVCSILLYGKAGRMRYHRFQRPGCPAVREFVSVDDGLPIGPWRFERPNALA